MNVVVHPFFDSATSSWSYVLANPGSACCAVIDPVLDYDPESGRISTTGADRIVELVEANGYTVEWILETHVHADHVSAARYLKHAFVCAQIAIGDRVREVQAHFLPRMGSAEPADGSQFDRLLADGERICLGHTCGRVMQTPGHTPACVTYVFEDFAFVGDTLFQPDYGTARCDFPGGDARALYGSIQKLYALPGATRLLMCHDYPPAGRDRRFSVSVQAQRLGNGMLDARTSEAAFVAARQARDATLAAPALLDVAVAANVLGGLLPEVERATGTPLRTQQPSLSV
ncbi:MAG: MBL fold metallo-hydrolase [Pseudomonadales bacterium]